MTTHFVGIYSRYGVICMYEILPKEITDEYAAKEYCLKTFTNSEDMHKFECIGKLIYDEDRRLFTEN